MLFLETGSPAKSAVHGECDLVNVFSRLRHFSVALGLSPPDTALALFQRDKIEFTRLRSFSGPNVSLFQQDPICLGPDTKVSCKQICNRVCFIFLQNRTPSFRLTQVLSCRFSGGVLTASVFLIH